MFADQIPEIKKLSPEGKYILANELWQEIEANESSFPVDEAVVKLLEKRHQEYLDDPTNVISWEELKKKLQKG